MAITQFRSKRKVSGKRYIPLRKKKLRELGRHFYRTVIGQKRFKAQRTRGGNVKNILLSAQTVNVYNPKDKTYVQATVKKVDENKANKQFEKANIITRGAIVDTDKGKVKITSRPGQHGTLNGVLVV